MDWKNGGIKKMNETRTENSYNIWDALDIRTRRFIQTRIFDKKKETEKR